MILSLFTNKGTRIKFIPDSWDKLTVDQFQKIVTWQDKVKRGEGKKDVIELFSIISGIEYDKLFSARDPDLEEKLYRCLAFMQVPFDFPKEPASMLTFFGVSFKVPKTTALSIGQNIVVRQRIEESRVYEQCLSIACASYLQPIVNNSPYDLDEVESLERRILEMPIADIYPLGFFLLGPLMNHGESLLKKLVLILRQAWINCIQSAKQSAKWLKLKGWSPQATGAS